MQNEEIKLNNYLDQKTNESYSFKGTFLKKSPGDKILKIKFFFYNTVVHKYVTFIGFKIFNKNVFGAF